jgi:hypothetical protein
MLNACLRLQSVEAGVHRRYVEQLRTLVCLIDELPDEDAAMVRIMCTLEGITS